MVPEASIVSQDVTEQRGEARSGGLSTKTARPVSTKCMDEEIWKE